MEREVGGGIGMGNTYKPMAVSFQCMTKFTTNKKNKNKKIIKILLSYTLYTRVTRHTMALGVCFGRCSVSHWLRQLQPTMSAAV